MPLRPESIRRKWERLERFLAPFRLLQRPDAEHGLRLLALEGVRLGDGLSAYTLAWGATVLPPEALGGLQEASPEAAAARVRELLARPGLPRRGLDPRAEARLLGRAHAVIWAAEARGLLTRDRELYVRALGLYREPDLRLFRAFLRAAERVYGEPGPSGLVLPPHFFTALEDFLLLWGEVARNRGFLDLRTGRGPRPHLSSSSSS